jgi:hypothetical protein
MTTIDIKAIASAGPPAWDEGEWDGFLLLLREWWRARPEDWTDRRVAALAIGLADFTAEQASGALRRLRDAGQKFPPNVGEIANAIHTNRDDPSFTEAYELLFGKGGAVRARPQPGQRFADSADRDRATDLAILQRAIAQHELVGAFVAAVTPKRLRLLPVDDPDYGELERRRLNEEWNDFVERADARRREGMPLLTAPLAERRELGPAKPNYLAAIGAPTPEDES